MSNKYYTLNAQAFIESTVNVNMQPLYDQFLPLLTTGAHIIDAGCGSGRDTKAFTELGYNVTAFDASKPLADAASKLSGQAVQVATFLEFKTEHPADAIWACASLLHVPAPELPATFKHLANQLKQSGIIYCSFKYGNEDVSRNGRNFTNATEVRLRDFISGSGLALKNMWITNDQRPGREQEKWLNAIVVKEVIEQ
ncbi:class I SAM-dependent methyltransferase [Reinekea marinisedimentorum]|uniref:Methyltransferase family protein n=1 Tax=Reinekea marinisedimentorum TaxID=230495 RepID=A0A4R3I5L7_9GAMM|nr:class I SAM-dependent methyltransferase [Reinekea marinisedimentorum]TCS40421.1 methyltransferase family protein [Reinekea marinisedimentorum]